MTMSRTETLSQPSEAAGMLADVIQLPGHALTSGLSGFLGYQGDLGGLYRSPLDDPWMREAEPILTGMPRRESPPAHPTDDGLEATLRALTKEVVDLREEVASLREIVAPLALSVREQRQRRAELFEEFVNLAVQWQAETAGASTTRRIVSHPAYLRMIGMGDRAVPWILAQLEGEEAHWFEALHAITGANPVPDEDRGVYAKMAQAWLAWGRDNGWIA